MKQRKLNSCMTVDAVAEWLSRIAMIVGNPFAVSKLKLRTVAGRKKLSREFIGQVDRNLRDSGYCLVDVGEEVCVMAIASIGNWSRNWPQIR